MNFHPQDIDKVWGAFRLKRLETFLITSSAQGHVRASRSFPIPQSELNSAALHPRNTESADSRSGGHCRKRAQNRGLTGGSRRATSWPLTPLDGCHNLLGRPHGKTCSLSTASARCGLLIGSECGSVRDTRFRSLEFCGERCCEAVDRAWIIQR